MFGRIAAALVLATLPAIVAAQSASAPLMVTATVVSSCKVDVPRRATPTSMPTVPVGVRCARNGVTPRVQLLAPRRVDLRGALVVVDF